MLEQNIKLKSSLEVQEFTLNHDGTIYLVLSGNIYVDGIIYNEVVADGGYTLDEILENMDTRIFLQSGITTCICISEIEDKEFLDRLKKELSKLLIKLCI